MPASGKPSTAGGGSSVPGDYLAVSPTCPLTMKTLPEFLAVFARPLFWWRFCATPKRQRERRREGKAMKGAGRFPTFRPPFRQL